MLTQELLKEYLRYDEDTGKFYWIKYRVNHVKIGSEAGSLHTTKHNKNTYRRTAILGRRYFNHTLVWLYHHGYLPKMLDHIDGNGLNNRIDNLRLCNDAQNQANIGLKSSNKSGYKGVHWHKHHRRWCAQIRHDGKVLGLGYFDDPAEAYKVYCEAGHRLQKEYFREI